jgi:hypothetical protein
MKTAFRIPKFRRQNICIRDVKLSRFKIALGLDQKTPTLRIQKRAEYRRAVRPGHTQPIDRPGFMD